MAHPYLKLRTKMSLKAKAAGKKLTKHLLLEMPLQELRQARRMSQEQLAKKLHTKQASVSKIERRMDMYISTLRGYLRGMGGELEVVARFPDAVVKIDQFRELAALTRGNP